MRVIVMGGTSGIGRATAELLVARGAEVTVTGRRPSFAVAGLDFVRLDATDAEAVAGFFAGHGPVEHLVLAFSPGPVGLGPLAKTPAEDIRAAFEGKLFGYLGAIQRATVTASITMISAASARAAYPGTTVLAAVNGAIERIVPPLAAELAPVRVNAVSPGAIDTPWWSFLPEDQRTAQFTDLSAALPARRIGTPAEVAGAVAYLVGAEYVTGTILPVDGGGTVS
ncbi:SDR family oxidoreductase [Dactylosporangium sp. NPDC051541]|uniref:SDR family oxidoreductase n=1 Tax=Dactylosporangium sp. NPDC051541 TaxID=3363977 RepID=UPI0037A074E7